MSPPSLAYLVVLLATAATAAPLARMMPDQSTTAVPAVLPGVEEQGENSVTDRQTGDGVAIPIVAPSGHDDAEPEPESNVSTGFHSGFWSLIIDFHSIFFRFSQA